VFAWLLQLLQAAVSLLPFVKKAQLTVSWEPPPATGDERADPRAAEVTLPSGVHFSDIVTSSPSQMHGAWIGADPTPTAWRWYHVRVQNRGNAPAKHARGYLAQLLCQATDGSFVEHPDWTGRLPLQWANTGSQQELTVHPIQRGSLTRLDVIAVGNGPGPRVLVTPTPLVGLPTALGAGTYRLLISVESDTSPPAQCGLQVTLGESWDQVEVHEVPLDLFPKRAAS